MKNMPDQVISSDEQATAAEKMQILWGKVKENAYQDLPQWSGIEILPLIPKILIPFKFIARRYMQVTVDLVSDYFPTGRSKVIHTYGAVCPVKFVSSNAHDYTGVFTGIEHGLIRLSLAKKPDKTTTIPGAAIKFLLDGVPSVNFMAMASLSGQPSYNFFKMDFSNVVPPPDNFILKILANAFATVSKDPTKVDVSELFRVLPNGEKVAQPKMASKLRLIPNRELLTFPDTAHDVREDQLNIPIDSKLYDVYAADNVTETLLGSIVTTDKFVCSKFGDEQLFFRHQRFDKAV
jgi:hypothetical protein